jgi:hypothetical protein
MNPRPWVNSVSAYAIAQALVATVLLFSFLLSTGDEDTPATTAWEWATFLPLLILLSSMPTAYHHCVLIFTVIVAVDLLLKAGRWSSGLAVAVLFAITCYPLPGFAWLNLQARLAGDLLLYLFLLFKAPARPNSQVRRWGVAFAVLFFAVLTVSNLRALRNRSEDFARRLPAVSTGYGTLSAARAGERMVLDEMIPEAFAAVIVPGGGIQRMPTQGDVLTVAAGRESPFVYFELTRQRSQIFRLPTALLGSANAIPEYVAEGHAPAISPNGRWLAYLGEEHGESAIWLSKDAAPATPAPGSQRLTDILEMSVTPEGNVIVAAGAADSHLFFLRTASGELRAMAEIRGAVRYPAISLDGRLLAFSRRESGAWHLFVRDMDRGTEQQLTSAACNATSASWEDSQTILYTTDCGRGLALGAAARVTLRH